MKNQINNCFAYSLSAKGCTVLRETYCKKGKQGDCPFYKPFDIAIQELDITNDKDRILLKLYLENQDKHILSEKQKKEVLSA